MHKCILMVFGFSLLAGCGKNAYPEYVLFNGLVTIYVPEEFQKQNNDERMRLFGKEPAQPNEVFFNPADSAMIGIYYGYDNLFPDSADIEDLRRRTEESFRAHGVKVLGTGTLRHVAHYIGWIETESPDRYIFAFFTSIGQKKLHVGLVCAPRHAAKYKGLGQEMMEDVKLKK